MSRRRKGIFLLLGGAVIGLGAIVALGYFENAKLDAEFARLSGLLDADLEEFANDPRPRPPRGEPHEPGFAIDYFRAALRLAAEADWFEHGISTALPRFPDLIRPAFDQIDRGTRTTALGPSAAQAELEDLKRLFHFGMMAEDLHAESERDAEALDLLFLLDRFAEDLAATSERVDVAERMGELLGTGRLAEPDRVRLERWIRRAPPTPRLRRMICGRILATEETIREVAAFREEPRQEILEDWVRARRARAKLQATEGGEDLDAITGDLNEILHEPRGAAFVLVQIDLGITGRCWLADSHKLRVRQEALLLGIAMLRHKAEQGAWPETIEEIRPNEVRERLPDRDWLLTIDPETGNPVLDLNPKVESLSPLLRFSTET